MKKQLDIGIMNLLTCVVLVILYSHRMKDKRVKEKKQDFHLIVLREITPHRYLE